MPVLETPREADEPLAFRKTGRATVAQLLLVPYISSRELGCRAASSELEELPCVAGEHHAAGTDLSARPRQACLSSLMWWTAVVSDNAVVSVEDAHSQSQPCICFSCGRSF